MTNRIKVGDEVMLERASWVKKGAWGNLEFVHKNEKVRIERIYKNLNGKYIEILVLTDNKKDTYSEIPFRDAYYQANPIELKSLTL